MAALKPSPGCSSSGVASASFGLSQSQVQQQHQQQQQNQNHQRWNPGKFHKFAFDAADGTNGARRMHGASLKCMCKNNPEEPSSSSDSSRRPWDRRLQAAVAKLGGVRDMLTIAGKKLHKYVSSYGSEPQVSDEVLDCPGVHEETEWDRWNAYFNEVEEQENLLAILKFELDEAILKEDYQEAGRLRNEISSIETSDTVGQLMLDLKIALQEERYTDAAKIRDETGAGLVGWWSGISGEGSDPFGKIVRITSSQGRLVATGYTARQLVTSAPGVPLFEVFYRKDEQLGYQRQAVYLQRERNTATDATDTSGSDGSGEDEAEKEVVKDEPKDEGLSKIMNFLKERMPDVKLKVFQVTTPDKLETDLPKIAKDKLKSGGEDTKKEEELGTSDDGKPLENQVQAQGKNAATAEELVEMGLRLLIGRLMQNTPEDKMPVRPVRVPAKLEYRNRDMFMFEIDDHGDDKLAMDATSSWKLALASPQSEPTFDNKVLSNSVKVSKEVADIIRLAVTYAQRRRGLAKSTAFQRIHLPSTSSDAFNGLYVGTLPPHSHQVLQLRQKLGNWQEDDETVDGDKFEFNEYVEAVKLVGDVHVPAGQIIFRAKTGRGCRLPHRGVYPDELGVVARYKGRGKVADPGFKNPHWIDGELLLLDGKGPGFLNGAQLCFVYLVGQPYFILYRRAMIDE